ncbi:MAG TPA: lipopolysaccharide biosynthesis protein [Roseateles sp.]
MRWAALAQVAKISSQLASITVLARLLTPADYGLLAIAAVFTNFAFIFKDLGTASAIIQRKELEPSTTVSVFWFNLLLGVLIFLVLAGISPWVARFYRIDALVPVLCLLALAFPLASGGIVHQALMERHSKFREVALIEGSAVTAALVVAIGCAFAGLGVYSLVLQLLTASLLQSLGFWWCSPWRPHGRSSRAGLAGVLGFSSKVSAFQFVNYFARNADAFVIGRLLGAAVLGMYSLAYRVMLFPVQNMSYVAARALLPVLSALHREAKPLAPAYVKSISVIAFVAAPLMAGVFSLREPFVAVVFGTRWSGLPELLMWLAPIGFLQSALSTSGTVFMSMGVPGLMFRLGLLATAMQLTGFLVGVQYGVVGLIIGYLIATLLNLLVTMRSIAALLEARLWFMLSRLLWPTLSAAAAAAATQALLHWCIGGWAAWQQLLVGVAAFSGVYLLLAVLFHRKYLKDCLQFVGARRGRAQA